MKFERKSAAEIAAMSADDQEKYITAKEANDLAVRKQEIEDATKEIKSDVSSIKDEQTNTRKDISDLAETVNVIKEKVSTGTHAKLKGFLHNVIKENYDAIKDAFQNKKPLEINIEKAPAMHMTNNGTVSNIAGLTAFPTNPFEVDDDIAYIRVPENFILNVIRNSQREKVPAQLIRRQQVATEGAVTVVAEGEVKPLLQYKFQNTSTTRKKYAGRIEWTEEFEMDFEELLDAIIDLFERDVLTAWQDGILEAIDTNATAYVGSTLDGTFVKPDNGLAVIAAIQQLKALGYTPNAAIMNPGDIDSTVYTQDINGNFALKPYVDASGNKIAGVTLIPSLKQDAGTAIVGDFSIYKEIHSRFIFRRGQYGEQFIENEYTAIGEVFSILSAAPANYTGVVKVNLATVKAALTAE